MKRKKKLSWYQLSPQKHKYQKRLKQHLQDPLKRTRESRISPAAKSPFKGTANSLNNTKIQGLQLPSAILKEATTWRLVSTQQVMMRETMAKGLKMNSDNI